MAGEPLRIPATLPSWQECVRRVSLLSVAIWQRLAGWSAANAGKDWLPSESDQWIGDDHQHPRGVVVGVPSGDPQLPGIQGAMLERTGAADGQGGLALIGVKNEGVRATPDPGTLANAPVEVSGTTLLLMGAQYLEVQQPVTEERYLLLGASQALADGRNVAPLIIGPQYIPALQESQQDATDVDVDLVLQTIVSLTLANSYAATVSSFRYQIRLSEEGGRGPVGFDVEIWRNGAFVYRNQYALDGFAQNFTYSTPLDAALTAGDLIELRVSCDETAHPSSDGWVRGTVLPTLIEVRQG